VKCILVPLFRLPILHYIKFRVKNAEALNLQSKIIYGKDAKNKYNFCLVLKVCGKYDDVTSAGKQCHVRANRPPK